MCASRIYKQCMHPVSIGLFVGVIASVSTLVVFVVQDSTSTTTSATTSTTTTTTLTPVDPPVNPPVDPPVDPPVGPPASTISDEKQGVIDKMMKAMNMSRKAATIFLSVVLCALCLLFYVWYQKEIKLSTPYGRFFGWYSTRQYNKIIKGPYKTTKIIPNLTTNNSSEKDYVHVVDNPNRWGFCMYSVAAQVESLLIHGKILTGVEVEERSKTIREEVINAAMNWMGKRPDGNELTPQDYRTWDVIDRSFPYRLYKRNYVYKGLKIYYLHAWLAEMGQNVKYTDVVFDIVTMVKKGGRATFKRNYSFDPFNRLVKNGFKEGTRFVTIVKFPYHAALAYVPSKPFDRINGEETKFMRYFPVGEGEGKIFK